MSAQGSVETEPNQKKSVTIVVNGRPREVEKAELTYDEIVRLAFPNAKLDDPNFEYKVTFSKGHSDKPDGILIKGKSVKVKEEMVFNVFETNKS